MRRLEVLLIALMAMLSLAGCASAPDSGEGTTAALPLASAYALSPGDKLKVKIFEEPDLSGEFQIDEGGNIAFPLIGDIQAAGLTVDDFRVHLAERLKNGYIRNPRLTVDVLNYRPINIIGEVKNAGQYTYRPGISARDIPAIAGGYTYRADEGTIYVSRGYNKKPITVNLDEAYFQILPGDTIKIPERFF
ncbi:MAG: polysaccharide export protein [Rhodomicrobium sp.]|nr:polysaccharide export protein [Rhodomicrobium sp.]